MSDKLLKLQALLTVIDHATAPLRQITGGSTRATSALKSMREQIKELQRQQSDITSFKKLSQGLSDTQRELVAASDKLNRLKVAVQATSNPSAKMLRELNQATEAVKRLKQAETEQTNQLSTVRQRLQQAGIDVNNLGRHEQRLAIDITRANVALQEQKEKLRRLNEIKSQDTEIKNKSTIIISSAASMGVSAKIIKAYAQSEDAATQLRVALMTSDGKAAKEYNAINAQAQKLGNSLPGTTADFQNMMTMLVRQGISAKTILRGVGDATAYLAVQMNMPFADAAKFVAEMQDATRTTEKDMLLLMDTIQRAYYLGVDSRVMKEAFSKAAPALDILRIKGLEAAKALAPIFVMGNQAGMSDGGSIGNAFRKIIGAGLKTKEIQKTLDDHKKIWGTSLNIDFSNGKGEFGGIDNFYKQMKKFELLRTDERIDLFKQLFGDDSEVNTLLQTIISKGQEGYQATLAKMKAQADLQTRVNEQLGTLKNLWDSAKGTFTNAMANFGEAVAPELKALTKLITRISEGIGNWAKENPNLANTLIKIIGLIAIMAMGLYSLIVAVVIIIGHFLLLRFILGYLGLSVIGLLGVFKLIGVVIGLVFSRIKMMAMANPFFAIMAAFSILVAWPALLDVAWKPIKALFGGIFDGINNGLNALNTAFGGVFTEWETLLTTISNLFGGQNKAINESTEAYSKWANVGQLVGDVLIGTLTHIVNLIGFALSGYSKLLALFSDNPDILPEVAKALPKKITPEIPAKPLLNQIKKATVGIAIGTSAATGFADQPVKVDMRPPLAQSKPSTVVHNNPTYTITVNAPAGLDAKQVANLVAQEVQKLQRQEQARKRSSLIDTD